MAEKMDFSYGIWCMALMDGMGSMGWGNCEYGIEVLKD